jgi:hypothetical protein
VPGFLGAVLDSMWLFTVPVRKRYPSSKRRRNVMSLMSITVTVTVTVYLFMA